MTTYFSVRSRALASLITALAQVLATLFMGTFLDLKRFTLNQRARYGFFGMITLSGGVWVWAMIIQHKYHHAPPALDWGDDGFGEGWALYVFQQVEFALTYNFGYWLIGWLAKRPVEVVRYAAVARGVEAGGQCIASGISSTQTPLMVSAGIILALWAFALVPGYFVVRKVGIEHVGAESGPAEDEGSQHSQDFEPPGDAEAGAYQERKQ